ncbi:MAG: hypothetical protein AB1486_14900 [Planctomycetota bacterium]
MRKFALSALAAVAVLTFGSTSALADGRTPGSLLVFPLFDSTVGVATVVTVTNTNPDQEDGEVYVEYRYIDGLTCAEFNRTEKLTPNDTLCVVATAHNAQQALGYLYVFAKNAHNGQPIDFDWLIGNEVIVDGIETFEYGYNPYSFEATPGAGNLTDVDGDGILDLDGTEYEMVADNLLFPRFFGQGGPFFSTLTLINLTGGTKFLATVDFLIFNDNEQTFSAEYSFLCWARVPLADISGAFLEQFLDTTDNDPDELVGLPSIELGWFRLDGAVASSSAVTLDDPAILGVLAEQVSAFGAADLPFEVGTQDNGDLLPRSVHGDS